MSALGVRDPHGNPHEHFVYRFFSADGALLYVGMTWRLPRRLEGHRRRPWFSQVRRTAIESHPDWRTARNAEARAIRTEHPRHNIAGRAAA